MSASFMLLLELEYTKRLQWWGWNSAAVMTSVSSSMFAGLISTMSVAAVSTGCIYEANTQRTEAPVADF